MKNWLPTIALLLSLSGCASVPLVPPVPASATAPPPSVAQAQAQPAVYRGRLVRWGGEIVWVRNLADATEIGVLRHDLYGDGEPRPSGGEMKRFVARIDGFLDPAEYRPGERLTVLGRLSGILHRPVGEYDYPYPVVQVQHFHRWGAYKAPPVPGPVLPPWNCGPFYPWGPGPGFSPYCW